MPIYWASQAAQNSAQLSHEAIAIATALGMLILAGIGWFFSDDEPQLPPGAITGWVPCMAG